MRSLFRILSTLLLLTVTVSALGYFFWYKPKFKSSPRSYTYKTSSADDRAALERVKEKLASLSGYAKANRYNTTYCFLMDMRIASGKKRFFVYNMEKDSVEMAGLVAHGSGSEKGGDDLVFSNKPNSHCTSLGKYKIGNSYHGRFGLAYKLYGLDPTNSKAFERFVVLHAHECIPADEVYPLPICESQGCPTVSPDFLLELKNYIDLSEKPVLLWVYN